ncbi:MAG: ABC transporter permease [Chloroflexi bacterium]|nr:ABC transporter permease [Chloroflexota bacterium]
MNQMFRLSMRQLAGQRRIAIIALLAALPILIAVLVSIFANDDDSFNENFINSLLAGMLISGILPIVTMALATTAFANELDDKTLSYLVLKPIRRSFIVLPKLLATIAIAGPLLVISGVVATILGLETARATLAVGIALAVGVITYASIFTWAGLISTRALGFALVYVFVWEGLITSFFQNIQYLSVRGYTMSIMYGLDKTGFESISSQVINLYAGIVGAAAVTVVFFLLTVRRLSRMDIP